LDSQGGGVFAVILILIFRIFGGFKWRPWLPLTAGVICFYVGKNSIYSNSIDIEVNNDKTEGIFGHNRSKRLS
jgi:hypothetical protein